MKRIHLLRPGTFSGSDGTKFTFSAANLEAIARNYDPARGEAPLTVGHPKTDHPAFGWVERLEFDAGTGNLYAIPKEVPPEFSAAVQRGAFKKISVALFGPEQPANPKPGDYYIRHVGFLGAHVPAVPGLQSIQFAADDAAEVAVEFAAPGAYSLATIIRRMREWLIGEKGLDVADSVIPDYSVRDLERAAEMPDDDIEGAPYGDGTGNGPSFASVSIAPASDAGASSNEDLSMPTVTQAQLDQRKADLDAREQELQNKEVMLSAQAAAARRATISADIDAAIADGRVLPVERAFMVELAASLDETKTIEFAAADGSKETINLFERWKSFLAALPPRVNTGELAGTAADSPEGGATFAAPAGYQVDSERLELHRKAEAYMAAHPGTTYDQASSIVAKS